MKSRHLIVAMAMAAVAVIEFAVFSDVQLAGPAAAGDGPAAPGPAPSASPAPAFDVSHLVRPTQKYVGVALASPQTGPSNVAAWTSRTGQRPNMLTIYTSFDDGFSTAQVREAYQQGALAIIRWEPYKPKLADIAAGKYDAYITEFAQAVRRLNLPIGLTFGHEMNGGWYPWGAKGNKPAAFVAAWRHVHEVFAANDAKNVIWIWTPNVINPIPSVKLKPLYPGDAYVDWVGLDGYYTHRGAHTYKTLFGPTMRQVEDFTAKPFLIVETAAEPGTERAAWIKDLYTSAAKDPQLVGLVWFNMNGSAPWNIDTNPAAQAAMRASSADPVFGFTVTTRKS